MRRPAEAVAALEAHCARDTPLVIATDEAKDPFVAEVAAAFRTPIFIDQYIVDNYGRAFADLPAHDSIALAFLTQQIAGHAHEFVGTMTSTFTALIHRNRLNNGSAGPFRFLWNELPADGDEVKRGDHAPSFTVPLRDGAMIETREGPYSWNRVSPRLAPAWMREWPGKRPDRRARQRKPC